MRPAAAVVAVVLILVPLTAAHAQHAEDSPAAQAAEVSGCAFCHGGHAGGAGYGLRTDDVSAAEMQAPGLGNVSKSCLRCHTTSSQRGRQPEFRGRAPVDMGRPFLGNDLSDDHPIGRMESTLAGTLNTWETTRTVDPFLSSSGRGSPSGIECVLCHDPHDRAAILPDVDLQIAMCAECHDSTVYTFQNHATLGCTDCHRLHGGRPGDLLDGSDSKGVCIRCHNPSGTIPQADPDRPLSAGVSMRAVSAPSGHSTPPPGDCIECHSQHHPVAESEF